MEQILFITAKKISWRPQLISAIDFVSQFLENVCILIVSNFLKQKMLFLLINFCENKKQARVWNILICTSYLSHCTVSLYYHKRRSHFPYLNAYADLSHTITIHVSFRVLHHPLPPE
ncbi:hypothetical protein RJT34_04341 [Clitoria ternatea]|uniref:Uncharacterized protein n=1 Tax=Clitoria ternatea TaxID=43366 RepID=A0AAN9KNX4_CLITE